MADLRLTKTTDLTGNVALVTGGGTGIGLMIAQGLAANGAKVYITGRRMDVLERATKEKIQGAQWALVPLRMDVTDKKSIQDVAKAIGTKEGKLDILVNNAGVIGTSLAFISNPESLERKDTETFGAALFEKETFEAWADTYKSNTVAVYLVTMAFLGLLEKGAHIRGTGETASVINITSTSALTHLSLNMFSYVTSKAASEHLTRTMATEFALKKIPIRVNAIAPGLFQSQMSGDAASVTRIATNRHPGTLAGIPAQRGGRPDEMATTAVYLASATGGFTNGQTIVVDGGYMIVNP